MTSAPADALDPRAVGAAVEQLYAFRARSRATQHRLARGERLGAETSVDKILLQQTEQTVFDLVADTLPADVLAGDDANSSEWRSEYLYSRASTIYGGTAEVQRNIVARRLRDLGEET